MATTYWFVINVLVTCLHMRTSNSGIIDDEACANNAQRVCRCAIAFEMNGNKKENDTYCKELQSCANCMATPRCNSGSLHQIRTLLRTTLIISKKTKICPDINYTNLDQGMQKSCKGEGKAVHNRCRDRCSCKAGAYRGCLRVRKEFTQMRFAERRRFVSVYYKATTDPLYRDDFLKILNIHAEIPTEILHDLPQIFFPWHRWFLLQAENFLRRIDCRVTIPYFQWTAAGKNVWRTTNPRDVWSGGPQGLGGNGVPPSHCVKDGKFREGNWRLPATKGGGCLKRDFNSSCILYNEAQLNKLLHAKSFKYFEETVREELHSSFHNCIGGNMPDNSLSAYSPEVLLHHAFIDKIWDQWQSRSHWHKFHYFESINYRMPFADLYPWQLLDNHELPGDTGVAYRKFRREVGKKRKENLLRSKKTTFM